MPKRLLVISAPSGAGKTTIAQRILARHPEVRFSVSATTRPQRDGEANGKDYFFLSREHFESRIAAGDSVEYESIFNNLYGTLKSEVRRALSMNAFMIFDVDVKGGLSLRREFPGDTLLIFIQPPSIEILRRRLEQRNSETKESIERRLARTQMEMAEGKKYDAIVVNDVLERAIDEVDALVVRELNAAGAPAV